MTNSDEERGAIGFAEKVLTLLRQGQFTATYKYAVMLSLMDLCLELSEKEGAAPSMVTTHQLAHKVVEMYWPHAEPFGADGDRILFQNRPLKDHSGGQAAILREIVKFRTRPGTDPSMTIIGARRLAGSAFDAMVRQVEWKLVEMPLPRLQIVGGVETPFLYRIGWGREISKRHFNSKEFHNAISFIEPANEYLVQLAGLLRPLIQREWAAMVARFNDDILEDAKLERFLFGAERITLAPVRAGLVELQEDRCFYCGARLRSETEVDHFVPWARHPNNAIENLVAAHGECNQSKRDHLASMEHVDRWVRRMLSPRGELEAIANSVRWESAPGRSLGVARSIYLRLPKGMRLWSGLKTEFSEIERTALRRSLSEVVASMG